MRIGIGYDIHRLAEERKLMLGGVEIPYIKGLLGYSDADVILHAISDAILGALSEGDLGRHFPDTDARYKDMPSGEILRKVASIAAGKGFKISNVDTMIIAEEPKIHPFREKMAENISSILSLDKGLVSIKATTNEGVGSIGRGEAIAAYAVVLLESIDG